MLQSFQHQLLRITEYAKYLGYGQRCDMLEMVRVFLKVALARLDFTKDVKVINIETNGAR